MNCTRSSQSYQEHTAAVARLFSLHTRSPEKLGTLVYVASKTYRRTLRRIRHPKYSLPFVNTLFDIEKSQSVNSRRPFPEDKPLHFRDIIFIKTLSEPNIQPILKLSEINIPNLMDAANNYQVNGTPPRIYTDKTCHEFHRLLCHLLRKFEEFLLALDKYTGRALSDDDMTLFDIAVYRVTICGITLQDLIYSSYLKLHLTRMELPDHGCRDYDFGQEQNGADMNVEGDYWDAELLGVQPRTIHHGKRLSVPDAYARWLRLQVVHFEAANKLLAVTSGRSPISFSLKVLGDYSKETQMSPWKKVIEKVMSIPTIGHQSCSVQDAIKTIEKVVLTNPAFQEYLNNHMANGGNFNGTLHCAASMASIIHGGVPLGVLDRNVSTSVDNVIGLSNQCCRVCSRLFFLLGAHEEYLEVPVLNQRVTACTLPLCLPPPVLESMINFFGKELKFLIQKMNSPSRSSSLHSVPDSLDTNTSVNLIISFLNSIRNAIHI